MLSGHTGAFAVSDSHSPSSPCYLSGQRLVWTTYEGSILARIPSRTVLRISFLGRWSYDWQCGRLAGTRNLCTVYKYRILGWCSDDNGCWLAGWGLDNGRQCAVRSFRFVSNGSRLALASVGILWGLQAGFWSGIANCLAGEKRFKNRIHNVKQALY
jgi:hypothetical protein